MRLVIEPGGEFEHPTRDEIATQFHNLSSEACEFAILSDERHGDEYYIQAAGDDEGGYVLEYREGSEDQHFVCKDVGLSRERVLAAFQNYAEGDSRYKHDFQWEKMEFGKKGGGCLGLALLILSGTGIIMAMMN